MIHRRALRGDGANNDIPDRFRVGNHMVPGRIRLPDGSEAEVDVIVRNASVPVWVEPVMQICVFLGPPIVLFLGYLLTSRKDTWSHS